MSERYNEETGEVLDIGLHGPLLGSAETAELWAALIAAQSHIEPPQRTKEAKVEGMTAAGKAYEYTYKYAPLDAVIAKIRKPLAEAGLGFQQFLTSRGPQYVVRTVIFHKSGQWTGVDYPIFYDTKKGAQGFASGVTYARRYGLTLAAGLAPEDDDDANVADARPAQIASRGRTAPKSAPAVSQAEEETKSARDAYTRLQYAIKTAASDLGALALIYDGKIWGGGFRADANLVWKVSPNSARALEVQACHLLGSPVATEADAGEILTK